MKTPDCVSIVHRQPRICSCGGAVRVDGEKISDIELRLQKRDDPYNIKVGKRKFIDIVVR